MISVKIPAGYFVAIDKLILKFMWKSKRPKIANTALKEKNQIREMTLPNFKKVLKAIGIKTGWCWQRRKYTDQRNRIESPARDLHKYNHVIFEKRAKAIHWSKDNLSNK